jgi:hypothetical protein
MKITDVFPALTNTHIPGVRRNRTWTKKGPGRRHNWLTRRQQDAMNLAMSKGATAAQCYQAFSGEQP